jgi:hypothetical protein
MKKFLALFLVAFATSFFATRAMADAVVVSPNGVGIIMIAIDIGPRSRRT